MKFIRREKPENTRKLVRRFCKKKSMKPEPESRNEDEPEAVGSSEDVCTGCEELCATTEQNCDWIKCVDCSKWLHELCTMYGDLCNSCGKQFIR
jgi:hypothetical protein